MSCRCSGRDLCASNRGVAGEPAGLSIPKVDEVTASLQDVYERLELLERIFLFVDVDQLNEAIKNATIPEIASRTGKSAADDAIAEEDLDDTYVLDSSLATLEAELQYELAAELSDQEADLEAELAKLNREATLMNELERFSADGKGAAAARSNPETCINKRATLSVAHHHVVTVRPNCQNTDTADAGSAATEDGDDVASWDEWCPLQLARLCENPRAHIAASQSCLEEDTAGVETIAVKTVQPLTGEVRGFVEALVGGSGGLASTGQRLLALLRENITQSGTFEEYRSAALAKVFDQLVPGAHGIDHVHGALLFLFYNAPRSEQGACRAGSMPTEYVLDALPVVVGSALTGVD